MVVVTASTVPARQSDSVSAVRCEAKCSQRSPRVAPDRCGDLRGDLRRSDSAVQVLNAQAVELRELLNCVVHICDIRLVVLGVMDLHGGSVNMGLQGAVVIWKVWE